MFIQSSAVRVIHLLALAAAVILVGVISEAAQTGASIQNEHLTVSVNVNDGSYSIRPEAQ